MANFKTHLTVSTGASCLAGLVGIKTGLASLADIPLLTALGALGGLLPDLDAGRSKSVRIVFLSLAFLATFVVLMLVVNRFQIWIAATFCLGTFIGIRYLIPRILGKLTSHRGGFHSLLATLFFGLGTMSLTYNLFGRPHAIACLAGLFVMFGYLSHLVLDEIYSVDLTNRRIKRSFGSALKIANFKSRWAFLVWVSGSAALFASMPSPHAFCLDFLKKSVEVMALQTDATLTSVN